MKRMLDLLYAGTNPFTCSMALPDEQYREYFMAGAHLASALSRKDLTTMLLLIAVAEGETL